MTVTALSAPDESRVEHVRRSRLHVDERFKGALPPARNLEGIRTSIAQLGILVPLITTNDLFVLDGHTRLEIAASLGLERVPVVRLPISRESDWAKTFAIAIGLDRRQLPLAQKVLLATSLLKQERVTARGRKAEGGAMSHGADSEAWAQFGPKLDRAPRSTEVMAKRVGLSRNTFEQALYVLEHAPQEIRERFLLDKMSSSFAFKELRRIEVRARAHADAAAVGPGIYRQLDAIPGGRYRTIYADPPWPYKDETCEGTFANTYPSLSLDELGQLDVSRLAHPDGCHLWLWTTWPKIRDGAPYELLSRWGFEWKCEVVWNKERVGGRKGAGRWLRSASEVCILAVRGRVPLLRDDAVAAIAAPAEGPHSSKPLVMRELIESCSPGPRIELFARGVGRGWDGFGDEAHRPEGEKP